MKDCLAIFTALSTSSLSQAATWQFAIPVAGLIFSKVFPLTADTNFPSIKARRKIFLQSFFCTNVCGLMTLKKKYELRIYLPYIQKILNFKKIATGTDNKKVMTNVILKSGIKILIPIDKNGEFDLQVQKEIAEKYKQVENIKTSIVTELDKIDKMEVSFL